LPRLPHGYTNHTRRDGAVVVKTYTGPDAAARLDREYRALQLVRGRVPVPPVLDRAPHALTLGFVAGRHGQDLIAAGAAEPVLAACGSVLRDIHGAGVGHGDFGPQNLLLDAATYTATAVLDWEFAAIPRTDDVVDLAWCEWIVRMHHPEHAGALDALFIHYGTRPPWRHRHRVMLDRCRELLDLAHRRDPDGPAERSWRRRIEITAGWRATASRCDGTPGTATPRSRT
jgi:tRNA A-37 threonylcarbamoyl transferase component Bud32